MPCTVVLCPWRKRSTLPRMMGTFPLPESGQTSKLFSKYCALERVVWRNVRWKKRKRLADRVRGSTKISNHLCRLPPHTMNVPQPHTRDSHALRSAKRGRNSRIRKDRHSNNKDEHLVPRICA